jgi:prefoldin alpha subunit
MTDAVGTMAQIRSKVKETMENLTSKKELLVRHKEQYEELKFKLFDYAQMKGQTPEITVQMTSRARVKGRIVDPSKILVFLGCEYFVERDPESAVRQVESRLKYLNDAIEEFTQKIKEAKQTVENIDSLVQFQEKEDQSTQESTKEVKNEEGLPFMDIREELDDDGNVLTSTIQPQNEKRLQDFGEEYGIAAEAEMDELNELLQDMGITKQNGSKEFSERKASIEPKIQELHESLEPMINVKYKNEATEETIIERDVSNMDQGCIPKNEDHEEAVSEFIMEREVSHQVFETEESIKEPGNEYFSMLKAMGISSKTQSYIKPEEKVNSHAELQRQSETVAQSHSLVPSELQLETEVSEPHSVEFSNYDPSQPAIDQEDIMQLQLIADEFEEDEVDYSELEYGFDQDDTDGDQDWDGEGDSLVPESSRTLFLKELERIRKEKQEIRPTYDDKNDELIETLHTATQVKKKKSVSFAKDLQIKEIENVSEELKKAEMNNVKVSKFKQMRQSRSGPSITENISGISEKEKPLTNDIVERDITVTTDAVEKDVIVEQEIQATRFITHKQEPVTSDIVERDITSDVIENTPEPPKKLSKFKTQQQSQPQSRFSKFKETMNTSISNSTSSVIPKPTPIVPPSQDPELTSTQVYENIRAYVLNDDEEEESFLKEMVENVSVYNPDMDEEDDHESDNEEEQDEDDDGPLMLDEIMENEEVEDPDYFLDENLISKEYYDLRRLMMVKYGEQAEKKESTIEFKEDEGQELEPIDEFGNPVKVSRFRKSIGKK